MYPRPIYKDKALDLSTLTDNHVATLKKDGASFFVNINPDGTLTYISRRPSVKGGFPDRTASLPHLSDLKLSPYASTVLNVELHHTGPTPHAVESSRQVAGILNSLPPRAIATQEAIGPVRAALINVVSPVLKTYREKLNYMKQIEEAAGKPDLFFVPEAHVGKEAIEALIKSTKAQGREGVIVTHLDTPEDVNVRHKFVHKVHYNLYISAIHQAQDIYGKPKEEAGAFDLTDATGKYVGRVGTGLSRAQRIEAHFHPELYIGRLIKVTSRGKDKDALRQPVYDGDADGDPDTVQ